MYPTLPKSYKGLYPFKLCTTSYIYPDHMVPNVEMLAPYLDEIEILFFESTADSLPSKQDIKQLALLAHEFDLTYNVHLPLDIYPGAVDPKVRHSALEIVKQIMDLTAPLSPSTFTLHLPYEGTDLKKSSVKPWQNRLYDSMSQLIANGISGERISIENLDYPLAWVDNILNDFNLSVCLDLGHLMVNRIDLEDVFNRYREKTTIIHLHGVKNDRDHLSLDRLSRENREVVILILKQFEGIVSLEVFSFQNLLASLNELENYE
ncbi:cobamide remodeling phosphodiesterase CbiR [Thermodesulfobacteriota bacterium]